MKVAIVGSRSANARAAQLILKHLPTNTSLIISGGAQGIDTLAQQVAQTLRIPVKVILPDYERYGKQAPFLRNIAIVEMADTVLAFWDHTSRGTMQVVAECVKRKKMVRVISLQ